jgi:hypothetical protein
VARVLELGPRARVAFAACWIAAQSTLVVTAAGRSDGAFGFRMFPEASTIEIHLQRRVGDRLVPVPRGEWSARDASGQLRHFAWRDRVRDPVLSVLDERRFASYGADAQLARLERALDEVTDHLADDAETAQLQAEVLLWRNGRGPETITRVGPRRPVP